jgi:nitrous oxidase accessory protein NosD
MRSIRRQQVAISLPCLLLTLIVGTILRLSDISAMAQASIRYVATSGADSGDCTDPAAPCRSVQYAVDSARDGDVIRVAAGRYTDVHSRPAPPDYQGPLTIAQAVYVSKTIAIQGGYAATKGFSEPPNPTANRTTLDAQRHGRVILVTGDISPTIEGLRIQGGFAGGLGGGLWGEDAGGGVYIDGSSSTLSNTVVADSLAQSGGGLYLHNSKGVILHNSIVSGNHTLRTNPSHRLSGGGLYVQEGMAWVEGNTFVANTAGDCGGGLFVWNSDQTMIDGNTVVDNIAYQGGGIHLSDYTNAPIIANAIISNAASYGGGLYISPNSHPLIQGNTIRGNSALLGGGLFLSEDHAALDGNTIQANAANLGAGLVLSFSSATLTNTLVVGNLGMVASGLYIESSSPRLWHTTVSGNGLGTGVWISATQDGDTRYPSHVWLTNTILVSHAMGISVAEGNTGTLAATLWGTGTWSNDADWVGAGTIDTGTVNLWADPAFVNPTAGDYRLGPGSAATDAGLGSSVGDDLDGEARPIGPGPDLGADEAGLLVDKRAMPMRVVSGGPLTYTLRITNTSSVDLQATITDLLPLHVTTTQPLGWSPLITAGGEWLQTVAVTVEPGYAGRLTNRVQVAADEGAGGVAKVTVTAILRVYLPLVLRAPTG